MEFTPGTLEASSYEGESQAVTFTGVNSVKASNLTIAVTSGEGVITSNATSSEQQDQQSFIFTVEISPELSPGTYSGHLDLRVCNGADCNDPSRPSWQMPYRFTVHPATNLTPLSRVGTLGGWSTYQGNAAHDGHVDATLDASAFLRRFNGPSSQHGVVTEGGQAFVVFRDNLRHWQLSALRESDGSEAWRVALQVGLSSSVSPPAVSAGRVFVTSTDRLDPSYTWSFDAATGQLVSQALITSQGEEYFGPTVFGGAAFSEGGYYGGLARFDGLTGALQWSIGLEQSHQWTPALDADAVYTYLGGRLRATNPADGSLKYEIVDPGSVGMGSTLGSPVLDGQGRAFAVDSQSRLVAFSLSDRSVLWSITDLGLYCDIALAGGMLYDVSGLSFEARSATTGAVQWTWQLPEFINAGNVRMQVIVANNLAFIAGVERLYVVDLATHQQVWGYPVTGKMSISENGVLYVVPREGGNLVAVNLH